MTLNAPRLLGRYQLEAEIGRGMMGVVYRALDPALGRTVALKTVSLRWSVLDEERESFERRFLTEAQVAAGLSHPNIVVVHDVGRDPDTDTLFIALEYLQGQTLAERLAAAAPSASETAAAPPIPIPWREAMRLTARVAEGLHHAHERGIVHRDVKPANIMILPSGEPKLMDFGIAKVPMSQLTSAGEFFGTPSYMSPEQAEGAPLDGRSDLFALGSVLYALLTGQRAFDGTSVPVILARLGHHQPAPPTRARPELPEAVDYIVGRCLAKDVAARYPDGRMLAEDIDDVLAGRPPRHRGDWTSPPFPDDTLTGGSAEGRAARAAAPAVVIPAAPAGAERNPVLRLTDKLGRRSLVGLVLLLVLLALVPTLRRRPTAGVVGRVVAPVLPKLVEPGHLDVNLRHPLKSGTVRIWVDDRLMLEEPLSARVTKRLLDIDIQRRGSVNELLDVSPGEHVVKVQVEAPGFGSTRRIRGDFRSGQTRHLEAQVGGILKKELSLSWGS